MPFHVGQKVVCIKVGTWVPVMYPDEVAPNCGCVLTIRSLRVAPEDGDLYLMFEEIINPERSHQDGFGEVDFYAERFRPLVGNKKSTETGMAILRKLAEDATGKRVVELVRD